MNKSKSSKSNEDNVENKLFVPLVSKEKQSLFFQILMLEENLPYRMVLQKWASGFIDRDGNNKFIKGFFEHNGIRLRQELPFSQKQGPKISNYYSL